MKNPQGSRSGAIGSSGWRECRRKKGRVRRTFAACASRNETVHAPSEPQPKSEEPSTCTCDDRRLVIGRLKRRRSSSK